MNKKPPKLPPKPPPDFKPEDLDDLVFSIMTTPLKNFRQGVPEILAQYISDRAGIFMVQHPEIAPQLKKFLTFLLARKSK